MLFEKHLLDKVLKKHYFGELNQMKLDEHSIKDYFHSHRRKKEIAGLYTAEKQEEMRERTRIDRELFTYKSGKGKGTDYLLKDYEKQKKHG